MSNLHMNGDDLFEVAMDRIMERWQSRDGDLKTLSTWRRDGENKEGGVSWHRFERWLVWEAYFACCHGLRGYEILPEPMYRSYVLNGEGAKSELGDQRADLLIRPNPGGGQEGTTLCLEFKLFVPSVGFKMHELEHEMADKIQKAKNASKNADEKWEYYQVVVFHRMDQFGRSKDRFEAWNKGQQKKFQARQEDHREGTLTVYWRLADKTT